MRGPSLAAASLSQMSTTGTLATEIARIRSSGARDRPGMSVDRDSPHRRVDEVASNVPQARIWDIRTHGWRPCPGASDASSCRLRAGG